MDAVNKIKELLVRGERERAVQELQKAFPANEEVAQIAAQFFGAKKDYNKDLLTRDEYNKTIAKVVQRITETIADLDSFRLLYIFSNPSNKAPLSFQDESRCFQKVLEGQHLINFISEPALQRDEFFEALRKHKPHFVHLSMHGDEEKGVYFKAENGGEDIMSPEELKKHFKVAMEEILIPLECVVLSCCNSMQHARLLAEDIFCVIGMDGIVTAPLANKFVKEFYATLTEERKYNVCFNSFVHVVETTNELKKYVSVPKLFMKN
jgi:hypothetical protein